jgi:hypothetical protein
VPHLLWHGTSDFYDLIWKTAPFSNFLGWYWGPLLTRISNSRSTKGKINFKYDYTFRNSNSR